MTMRRVVAAASMGMAIFYLAGCATATIEDAVPAGALSHTQAHFDATEIGDPAGSDNSVGDNSVGSAALAETYPDLNAAPTAAAPQISAKDKAERTAALRARRAELARNGAGPAIGDDGAALRQLADRRAEEVLKEIEGN